MKLSNEFRSVCSVAFVALLVSSLAGCSDDAARNEDQAEMNSAESEIQTANANMIVGISLNPIGSEKLATVTTVAGWQYAIGNVGVSLPTNGTCLVTCDLDVQSHALTGYLTFRTARKNVKTGISESDDNWAMDVPVPISQGSASASYAWKVTGGEVNHFGCRMLPSGPFVGIPVYPRISWICR